MALLSQKNLSFFTPGFVQYGYNATFPTTVNSNERSGFGIWLLANTGKHPDMDSPELSLLPPVSNKNSVILLLFI